MLEIEVFSKSSRCDRLKFIVACKEFVYDTNADVRAFNIPYVLGTRSIISIQRLLSQYKQNTVGYLGDNFSFEFIPETKTLNCYHIKITTLERDELMCTITQNEEENGSTV